LRAQLVRLASPGTALRILAPCLPVAYRSARGTCTLASAHADRFVLRVDVRSEAGKGDGEGEGGARTYALKVYADDFGHAVWTHAQALAAHLRPADDGLVLPLRYVPAERMLVFPWVAGTFFSAIVDERKPGLLRRAARLAARLHRLPIAPEPPVARVPLARHVSRRLPDRHARGLPAERRVLSGPHAGSQDLHGVSQAASR